MIGGLIFNTARRERTRPSSPYLPHARTCEKKHAHVYTRINEYSARSIHDISDFNQKPKKRKKKTSEFK